nr:Orf03 [Plesiomonas shigelloides]
MDSRSVFGCDVTVSLINEVLHKVPFAQNTAGKSSARAS